MTIKKTFLRTEFNYDTDEVSDQTGIACKEPSLTQQSFKEECDINTIIERFGLSGKMPENVRAPTYGDFSEVNDFHSAMNAIAASREAFERMPAAVRAEFQNDPGRFVDFCSDPENTEKMVKMGLAIPKETPEMVSPRPVTSSNELDGEEKPPKAKPSENNT